MDLANMRENVEAASISGSDPPTSYLPRAHEHDEGREHGREPHHHELDHATFPSPPKM